MSKTKTAPMPKEQTQHDREIRDLNAEAARLRAETAKLNAETAQRQAENTKAIAELRASNAETAKQLAQTNAQTAKQLATLGARAEEADKRAEEADKRAEEADKRAAKRAEEADKRAEAADKRAEALDKRADKALAASENALKVAEKNNKYIGDHSRNEGELLETQCYNTLKQNREINGIKLDDFHWGRKSARYAVEVDIIGFNGKVVMPIEVKRTMSPADVRRFAEVRVGRFKKAFPQYAAGKQTIPVIIFAMPRTGVDADGKPEDPVQLALDLGLTVLQSVGESQLSPITDPDQVISRPHETTDLT